VRVIAAGAGAERRAADQPAVEAAAQPPDDADGRARFLQELAMVRAAPLAVPVQNVPVLVQQLADARVAGEVAHTIAAIMSVNNLPVLRAFRDAGGFDVISEAMERYCAVPNAVAPALCTAIANVLSVYGPPVFAAVAQPQLVGAVVRRVLYGTGQRPIVVRDTRFLPPSPRLDQGPLHAVAVLCTDARARALVLQNGGRDAVMRALELASPKTSDLGLGTFACWGRPDLGMAHRFAYQAAGYLLEEEVLARLIGHADLRGTRLSQAATVREAVRAKDASELARAVQALGVSPSASSQICLDAVERLRGQRDTMMALRGARPAQGVNLVRYAPIDAELRALDARDWAAVPPGRTRAHDCSEASSLCDTVVEQVRDALLVAIDRDGVGGALVNALLRFVGQAPPAAQQRASDAARRLQGM